MFSDETTDLLMEISSFSNKKINNLNDVGLLIELNDSGNALDAIAFTSKYITGLKSVMSQGVPISEVAKENIHNEFTENVSKLRDMIEKYIESSDDNMFQMFKQKYLQLNQESFLSFLSLTEDLSLYKEFSNRNKKGLSN